MILLIFQKMKKKINSNEIIFIIRTFYYKNFDYFPITIELYNSKKNRDKFKKEFDFLLYQGFLSKINLFLNNGDSNTYFYEYFYLDIYNILNNRRGILLLKDNNKKIDIDIYDNFNSKNRIRINLMNVPRHHFTLDKKEQDKNNDILISKISFNSIQVCYLIKENYLELFGIFNIKEINVPVFEKNDIFDNFYDDFGNIHDEIKNNDYNINNEILHKFIDKYNNSPMKNNNYHLIGNFEENISLSQYKTRLGFIICYYFNLKQESDSFSTDFCVYLRNIDFYLKNKNIELF